MDVKVPLDKGVRCSKDRTKVWSPRAGTSQLIEVGVVIRDLNLAELELKT